MSKFCIRNSSFTLSISDSSVPIFLCLIYWDVVYFFNAIQQSISEQCESLLNAVWWNCLILLLKEQLVVIHVHSLHAISLSLSFSLFFGFDKTISVHYPFLHNKMPVSLYNTNIFYAIALVFSKLYCHCQYLLNWNYFLFDL